MIVKQNLELALTIFPYRLRFRLDVALDIDGHNLPLEDIQTNLPRLAGNHELVNLGLNVGRNLDAHGASPPNGSSVSFRGLTMRMWSTSEERTTQPGSLAIAGTLDSGMTT